MKKALKFIKETLLITLFAVWLLSFCLNIYAVSKDISPFIEKISQIPIKDLWRISLIFIFPTPLLFYYIPLLPLVFFFSGLVNLSINCLSKKHAFTYSFKNRSKRFNSFFAFLIKGFFAIIIVILTYDLERIGVYRFIDEKNIHIPQIILLGDFTGVYLIWIFFSLFYISLFYFIADKLIGFYKRRKDLKIK